MIHAIIVDEPGMLPVVVASFEAKKIPSDTSLLDVYKSGNTLLIDGANATDMDDFLSFVSAQYIPDTIFFLSRSIAVSDEKREGDVVLPNVFFHYNKALDEHVVSGENRDAFVQHALFISQYDKQNDYDFESF